MGEKQQDDIFKFDLENDLCGFETNDVLAILVPPPGSSLRRNRNLHAHYGSHPIISAGYSIMKLKKGVIFSVKNVNDTDWQETQLSEMSRGERKSADNKHVINGATACEECQQS